MKWATELNRTHPRPKSPRRAAASFNQSPEPTADSAGSSASRATLFGRPWLSSLGPVNVMRQNIQAVLLVALLQLLWVAAEASGWQFSETVHRQALKVSVGFPVSCASYTAVHTTGDVPPWENYPERTQWLPGIRVSVVYGILDALVVVAAFLGFRWLLRFDLGRAACIGFVLGFVGGVLASFTTIASWRPTSTWILTPLVLIGIPTSICFMTRRVRSDWQAFLMLAVAFLVMPWASERVAFFQADHGFSFLADSYSRWSPSIEQMVFFPFLCIVVLSILVLLLRRFVPFFRKHENLAAASG